MTPADERRIAQAATEGPWEVRTDDADMLHVVHDSEYVSYVCTVGGKETPNAEADAEFIETFNPQKVLELLDQIEQLQAVVRDKHDECTYQTRLAAVEKLHGKYPIYDTAFACADRTERHSQEAHMEVDGIIVCTDLPLYAVCAQCRDEEGFHTINWPCDTIKAAHGE